MYTVWTTLWQCLPWQAGCHDSWVLLGRQADCRQMSCSTPCFTSPFQHSKAHQMEPSTSTKEVPRSSGASTNVDTPARRRA